MCGCGSVETNYEHYKDEITKIWTNESKFAVVVHKEPRFGVEMVKVRSCNGVDCYSECKFHKDCQKGAFEWLNAEYHDPEEKIDWVQVPVDTPILIKNPDNGIWLKRHFAEYKNGQVYAFINAGTSWTSGNSIESCDHAKIADENTLQNTKLSQVRTEFDNALRQYYEFSYDIIWNGIARVIDKFIDDKGISITTNNTDEECNDD